MEYAFWADHENLKVVGCSIARITDGETAMVSEIVTDDGALHVAANDVFPTEAMARDRLALVLGRVRLAEIEDARPRVSFFGR